MPDEWKAFRSIIVEEMESFTLAGLGGKKKWYPTGVFRPIAQVLDCGIVSDVTEIESVTCTCGTHDELQSYFYDNCRLLQLFCLQLAQCIHETKYRSLCSTIEKLENILNHKWPHENTI